VVHNGKLYLIGGCDGEQDLSTVYSYSREGNKWEKMANMNTDRAGLATAVFSDRIVVSGGRWGDPVSSCEVYDATKNKWSGFPSMNYSRYFHQMFNWKGNLVVMGDSSGENQLKVEEYISNEWKPKQRLLNKYKDHLKDFVAFSPYD